MVAHPIFGSQLSLTVAMDEFEIFYCCSFLSFFRFVLTKASESEAKCAITTNANLSSILPNPFLSFML